MKFPIISGHFITYIRIRSTWTEKVNGNQAIVDTVDNYLKTNTSSGGAQKQATLVKAFLNSTFNTNVPKGVLVKIALAFEKIKD